MPTHVDFDDQRMARLDGRPFFLIGARHLPEGGTVELLRDAGFNTLRSLPFGTESDEPQPIPSAPEGIYLWAYLYSRADFTRSGSHETQLRDFVRQIREHPQLLCYENYNEPTLLYKSDRFKTQPEDLARGTAVVRELDPHHPVWLVHRCGNTVETLQRFDSCADIVGSNPYPIYVPGMRRHIGVRADGRILDCPDQSIHAVGRYTEKMMAVAAGRPVWMLVQAMANEGWFNPIHTPELASQGIDLSKVLYPTFEQMRFMAYDAIVHGATGLAFSMWRTPAQGPIWKDICRLVGELRQLGDALTAPAIPAPIRVCYSDLGFSIWDGVRTVARQKGATIYLFAVNAAFDPAQATFELPAAPARASAVVEGEHRECPLEGNRLSDFFEPYGVHVYRIAAPARAVC